MKSKSLTPKQKLFVSEFCRDKNAARSYAAAYPSVKKENTARSNGSRLLTNADIRAAIDSALEAQQRRLEISADRTLLETARIAFADIRKLVDESGALKDIADLDDDTAAAIAGVEERQAREGGRSVTVKRVRLWDKNAALEKLGKHFKLFSERMEVSGPDGGPVEVEQRVAVMAKILAEIEMTPHGLDRGR
jgi:phage terminase small subunit